MPDEAFPAGAVRAPGDLPAFLDRWRRLHGGVDPRASVLVRRWLTAVHACATPLARGRVRPDVLTLLGLALAVAAVPVALAGGRWAVLVAAVIVASAVLDGLDGAVAVLSDRVSCWGALLDAVCDRCADVAVTLALALLVAVSPRHVAGDRWLVAVTGCALVLPLLHEYVRARAGGVGLAGLEVVTVGERPTRLIVVIMFALAAGIMDDATWAFGGLAVLAAVSLAGLATLLRGLYRRRA
jgi:CDP-diacylglycerol--glycerol-3-phosphate 3-phosphatidyltransferase